MRTHLRRDNEPRLGPVQDDEALLLYGLVRALRPRTIVEFGTSHGFSALNWLHAIADDPQALVHSYDILPYPSAQALEDSDPRFIFHGKSQADFEASDVAPRLVDVAFFDAGHLVEYSLKAFERLLPALAPNAIIAVHDTGLHVRDFGSSAPQEEEGLPFNLQRCAARAGGQQRSVRQLSTSRPALRFRSFAVGLEKVSAEKGDGSKLRKLRHLEDVFNSVGKGDLQEMKVALKLLLGRLPRLQVGGAVLLAAADEMGLARKSPKETLERWISEGQVADIGEGWQRLLEEEKLRETDWTLQEVWDALGEMARLKSTGAQLARAQLAAQLALGCGSFPAGGKYIARILLGQGLGIGASGKTVALAFARQRRVPNGERLLDMLEVNPDIDVIVDKLSSGDFLESQLFSPISPQQAQPARSVEEVQKKMKETKGGWTAEWKYDGERLQIHFARSEKMMLFSRNLKTVTERYPQIEEALEEQQLESIILDAEVVAVDGDRILPFQILSRRPRKATDQDDSSDAVAIYAFDCLFLNGESLLPLSLRERQQKMREVLEEKGMLKLAQGRQLMEEGDLQQALEDSIAASTEGLMLKSLSARYKPGARTREWMKLKKDYLDSSLSDSIDAVVVGVKRGQGQRSQYYGSYLLAVRKSTRKPAKYQTICAVGGLTNEKLAEYYTQCERLVGRDAESAPKFLETSSAMSEWLWIQDISKAPVMEITGADLTLSQTHSCAKGDVGEEDRGIGLRFPRVVRARPDKGAEQATTAAQIKDMYLNQPSVQSATGPPSPHIGRCSLGPMGPLARLLVLLGAVDALDFEVDAGAMVRRHRSEEVHVAYGGDLDVLEGLKASISSCVEASKKPRAREKRPAKLVIHVMAQKILRLKLWKDLTAYNTGVYVANLERWKRTKAAERFQELAAWVRAHNSCPGGIWKGGSQPPLTLTFQLHPEDSEEDFTLFEANWRESWNTDGLGLGHGLSESDLKQKFVLHWSGLHKPWKQNGNYRDYWLPLSWLRRRVGPPGLLRGPGPPALGAPVRGGGLSQVALLQTFASPLPTRLPARADAASARGAARGAGDHRVPLEALGPGHAPQGGWGPGGAAQLHPARPSAAGAAAAQGRYTPSQREAGDADKQMASAHGAESLGLALAEAEELEEILRQHSQSCGHEGPVRPESRRSERAEELLFRWDKEEQAARQELAGLKSSMAQAAADLRSGLRRLSWDEEDILASVIPELAQTCADALEEALSSDAGGSTATDASGAASPHESSEDWAGAEARLFETLAQTTTGKLAGGVEATGGFEEEPALQKLLERIEDLSRRIQAEASNSDVASESELGLPELERQVQRLMEENQALEEDLARSREAMSLPSEPRLTQSSRRVLLDLRKELADGYE
ncbi:unnamed protein product, partial [Effrenium voratum]